MREAVFREQEPDPRSLSPAVEAAVADALDSGTASLPVALARASAEAAVGDDADPSGIDAVSAAVASLSGYAHLRRELLAAPGGDDRAVALLASDYLQASAHAALGAAAVPPDRHRELYATLTAGSADLATALSATSAGQHASEGGAESATLAVATPSSDRPVVAATLAETGCALGAAVGAASRETVEAMAAYGRSLVTAAGRSESETSLERIEAVVGGDRPVTEATPTTNETPETNGAPGADGTVGSHLERARTALESLSEGEARERLERATRVIGGRSSG